MMSLRFILVVVAITLGFSIVGCSQGSSPEPTPSANESNGRTLVEEPGEATPQKRWWRDESIVAELELSDDQVQAINDLMTVTSGEGNQQRQRERQLSLRYARALNREPYDPAMVDRLTKQLTEVLSSKHRLRIENVRAMRDILTHDQWTKLWEVAPQALQIGSFRVLLGPKISVSNSDPAATPTP